MQGAQEAGVLDAAFTVLSADVRVDAANHSIQLQYDDGVLTLDGEVPDIAMKRLASALCSRVPDVRRVVDRVRVQPAEAMGDGAIRDHVRDALMSEPALDQCSILETLGRKEESVRDLHDIAAERGDIHVSVEAGVVTLKGHVPSLAHARLAVVLAWWVPGTRNVVNELAVVAPEEDADEGELADAVHMALEKDPFVDAAQVQVSCWEHVVTLRGAVRDATQARMAERDAWFVPGVRDVKNELSVV